MDGSVYCMSNPSMPGILKIGIVEIEGKTPEDRARELFTTGVPMPFKVEFARCGVRTPREKERALHAILERQGYRVYPRREFFRMSVDDVRPYFDLIDGTWWAGVEAETEEDDEEESEDEDLSFAQGPQFWSIEGIRKFIDEDWKSSDAFKTEDLYHRLVAYCQAHNYPYYAEKEGMTKPHVSGLGCILRRHFVSTGSLQMRRVSGNKAVYWKPAPTTRE